MSVTQFILYLFKDQMERTSQVPWEPPHLAEGSFSSYGVTPWGNQKECSPHSLQFLVYLCTSPSVLTLFSLPPTHYWPSRVQPVTGQNEGKALAKWPQQRTGQDSTERCNAEGSSEGAAGTYASWSLGLAVLRISDCSPCSAWSAPESQLVGLSEIVYNGCS